jgi:hypothetical protein
MSALRSRGRLGPCANAAAQARARWRYAVIIGFRDPPPSTGSPRRRRCSSTRRDRRPGFLRGIGAVGLTNTSTSPFDRTPSKPKPSRRQRLRNRAFVFTPLVTRRTACGEPNFIACGSAIDPLQNELEVEGQLKLADHDDRRMIGPQRQQIAPSDLTFDNEAEPFEEGLDRPIEQRLQNRSPDLFQLEASFRRLRLQSLKRWAPLRRSFSSRLALEAVSDLRRPWRASPEVERSPNPGRLAHKPCRPRLLTGGYVVTSPPAVTWWT